MSIWDNMKKFAQPYNDDEFDDFDDYDDDYEDMDEEPAPRNNRRSAPKDSRPSRRSAPQRKPQPKEEPEEMDEEYDDDYDDSFKSVPKAAPKAAPAAPASAPVASSNGFSGRVVNMNRNASQELVRYHPGSFADSKKAAKDLISNKAVILNLEDVDKDTSRRMVDFLSGVVFAMDGDVQKVAMSTYVFCPPNVIITGGPETADAPVEETV